MSGKQEHVPHKTHKPTNVVKMVETMKDGKMPSNAAFTTELDATKDYLRSKEKTAATDKEAKTLKDARLLVEATQEVINEKNPDEQVQQFVKDVKKVTEKAAVVAPTGKIEARWVETRDLITSLKDLLEPLLQSPHFRKILYDTVSLLMEIFQTKAPDETTVKHRTEEILESKKPMKHLKQTIADTANALKETSLDDLPREQRQKIRKLFKKLLKEISAKPESTKAFRNLIKLMKHLKYDLFVDLKKGLADRDVKKVQIEAKDIVERFTGGRRLDDFLNALRKALKTIRDDYYLRFYIEDLNNYIESGLGNPSLIKSDDYLDRGDALAKKGREFAHKYKHNPTLNRVIDEAKALLDEIRKDEALQQLKLRALKFCNDFTYQDSRGHRHIDMDIVSKLRVDIIPFISERIKEVPIPKIEVKDSNFEYLILDDMYLSIDHILPNMIQIHSENDIDFNVKELKADRADSIIKFKLIGLKPKIKDFYFAFKRKKLLKLEDEGRATILVKGAGLDINIDFNIKLIHGVPGLGAHRTAVNVHKLDVDILDAKHKVMLNILTSLFSGRIEKQVQKALAAKIDSYGHAWAEYVNKHIFEKLPTRKEIQHKIEEHIPVLH